MDQRRGGRPTGRPPPGWLPESGDGDAARTRDGNGGRPLTTGAGRRELVRRDPVNAALIVGNASSSVEFSLLAARRQRIEQWVDDGRFGAAAALAQMRSLNLQLATRQLGITRAVAAARLVDRAGDRVGDRGLV